MVHITLSPAPFPIPLLRATSALPAPGPPPASTALIRRTVAPSHPPNRFRLSRTRAPPHCATHRDMLKIGLRFHVGSGQDIERFVVTGVCQTCQVSVICGAQASVESNVKRRPESPGHATRGTLFNDSASHAMTGNAWCILNDPRSRGDSLLEHSWARLATQSDPQPRDTHPPATAASYRRKPGLRGTVYSVRLTYLGSLRIH